MIVLTIRASVASLVQRAIHISGTVLST